MCTFKKIYCAHNAQSYTQCMRCAYDCAYMNLQRINKQSEIIKDIIPPRLPPPPSLPPASQAGEVQIDSIYFFAINGKKVLA